MSSTLAAVPGIASQFIAAAALVAALLALAATRRPALALGILLDMLVAAGLLRLVGDPSWRAIATIAIVIAIRHLVAHGLRLAARSWKETEKEPPDRTRRRYEQTVRHLLQPAWRR
ncbi:DUF1622 domain-containing protein [Blastococcus saxobsidens]|uniref:DUF1622 domain-containing protein n=1 Tax=Blastococcus saxobsidens (strain DD2) TaxID=1146883 RepID=H6RLM9_BLASD|nr:DUF1622 domain-containing protein [Blastococcus saxobsidens]CCG03755.1 conserved membrane protein of unknown function [Blastococcus saxobsidens DD2]